MPSSETINELPEQSNEEGLDWNSPCPYCGNTQKSHVWTDHPSYWHRMPCDQQKEIIRNQYKQKGVFFRTLFAIGILLTSAISFVFSWLTSLHWVISALAVGLFTRLQCDCCLFTFHFGDGQNGTKIRLLLNKERITISVIAKVIQQDLLDLRWKTLKDGSERRPSHHERESH